MAETEDDGSSLTDLELRYVKQISAIVERGRSNKVGVLDK